MLGNNARNNMTEVSKASQFGLNQSIRGLAVVGIAALVFVVWGISSVDYLTIYPPHFLIRAAFWLILDDRDKVVKALNDSINIPFINEKTEAKIPVVTI